MEDPGGPLVGAGEYPAAALVDVLFVPAVLDYVEQAGGGLGGVLVVVLEPLGQVSRAGEEFGHVVSLLNLVG